MKIPEHIHQKVLENYGRYYERLSGIDALKLTNDVLSFEKPKEQIGILERYLDDSTLRGKKILEIGSGFGIFIAVTRSLGLESRGIEPGSEGFHGSCEVAQEILRENKINESAIVEGIGESIPFPDASFDVVFSSNVLEHVSDPKKVISEAIRVCKPGGLIQIVAPSYGSFFDGHYAVPYIPYQPKWLWKVLLRNYFKRSDEYVDTLRTNLNAITVRKWLGPHVKRGAIQIISLGEDVFRERMNSLHFTDWAGLGVVKKWIEQARRLKLISLAASVLVLCKAHTPLIITLRKS